MATDVIGRGIDIKNVKTIINHDLPVKVTEYNNRIGRTARIGHEGKAISFYDTGTDSAIARRLCKGKNWNLEIPFQLETFPISEFKFNQVQKYANLYLKSPTRNTYHDSSHYSPSILMLAHLKINLDKYSPTFRVDTFSPSNMEHKDRWSLQNMV